MIKNKIINLIDKIFISISIFLIIYAWINFFIRDLWITFILSLVFCFACVFLLFQFLSKRQEKKHTNKKYLLDIEEKFLAFKIMNNQNKLNLIQNIISMNTECKIKKDYLLFSNNGLSYQILFATHIEKLKNFDLLNLIEKVEKSTNVLLVFCCDSEANLNTKILKNLKIEIINKKKLYDEFFLKSNTMPDCSNLQTEKEKIKLKLIAKNFFTTSKAKSYFLCGLVLIFSAIILPYHIYYLIFGSILLIISIVCKLQPFFTR